MNDTGPAPDPNPGGERSVWQRVRRPLLIVGAFVVVFGVLLPQIIDYGAVVDALGLLTFEHVLVLVALLLARIVTSPAPTVMGRSGNRDASTIRMVISGGRCLRHRSSGPSRRRG